MKKLTSLLMLALFLFTGLSMKAQESETTYYRPGSRLSLSEISEGTNVFIYVMCYENGNINRDYSRFIVNSSNNATTLKAKPGTFVTSNVDHIWQVASKDTYTSTSGDREAVQLVFKRKMGTEAGNNLWGIGSLTNNSAPGDPQKMVVTQWKEDAIISGASKSGTDVWLEDASGNIIAQSALSTDDAVYLVSALTGKSVNTSGGSYQSGKVNGYPVAFYSVETTTTDLKGFHASTAPAADATAWADGTTWYKMVINSGDWRYLDTSASYCDENGNLKMTNAAAANNLNSYWAITGNDNDGYKFYNAASGPSKVLGITGSGGDARMTMVEEGASGYTTSFDITAHTDGCWYIKKHGTDNDYINCRSPYVALWETSDALGNSGSAFQILEVDLTKNASTIKTNLLSRIGMWKKVPAIWAGASTAYDALNNVTLSPTATNTELVTAAAAQKTAGAAFVSSVNGVRFTASNRDNRTAARIGAFMYMDNTDSDKLKGRTTSTATMDEVFTIKANSDITFKIYNANVDKYIGTPGGSNTGAVAVGSTPDFDIFTSSGYNDNVVVFRINGTASMHLLNDLNVSNWSDIEDRASRWLLSTDVSRHELQTAIVNATTWKTNLETLIDAQKANLSQSPYVTISTLASAIATAQSAFDATSGTQATRTAAITALNAALTKAQGTWLGELGTAQQFRFKMSDGTNDYYLTTGFEISYTDDASVESAAGNARLITPLDESNKNQLFTLVPGAETGKYILQSCADGNLQLTNIGGWNTEMSASGSAYKFEEVDLTVPTFKLNTGVACYYGDQQGRLGTAETTLANDTKLFTDKSVDASYVTWTLEFVAPTGSVDDAKAALQAEYNRVHAWYTTNWKNLIKTDGPTMKAYTDACTSAEQIIASTSGLTLYDVNTAKVTLTETYKMMLQNLLTEADPRQFFALRNAYEKPVDNGGPGFPLYMEIVSKNTAEGIKLQAKATTAETKKAQSFKFTVNSDGTFVIGTGEGQKIVKTSGSNWDTQTADQGGHGFIIESVESVEGGFRILTNANQGFGPNMQTWQGSTAGCNVVGAPIYYNQAPITNENLVWVLETVVSSELMEDMKSSMDRLSSYNTDTHIGTGLGQYSYTGEYSKDYADIAIAKANAIYTSSGAYEETPADNVAILNMLNTLNNTYNALAINQPTLGKLYRFKGKASGKYMCAATASSGDDKMSMVESLDNPGVIFQLKEGETIDGKTGYKLLSYNTGYYNKNTYGNGVSAADANSFCFYNSETVANVGYYTIQSNYSGSKYVYDNSTVVDRNGGYKANNCDWQIEEVTELPVPINTTVGYGYGTLCSPVALKGVGTNYAQDARLEFYCGKKEGDKLKLTKLEGDIPAETGLIVKYKGGVNETTGCVYMEIADTKPTLSAENSLTGTIETIAKPSTGTVYTLQKPENSPLGFYNFTGTKVKGGKAYLHVVDGEAAPMGLVFDFGGETTGVESIEVNADNQVIYDLSGRRVAKAGKGLYIINGKKVLVK